MNIIYCARWNFIRRTPIDPIDAIEAERRWNDGPWFTVVIMDGNGAPAILVETEPKGRFVRVLFLASSGSVQFIHIFRRESAGLFLIQAIVFTYSGDQYYRQMESIASETFSFEQDGRVFVTRDDKSGSTIRRSERRDIDVPDNWLPVPRFGDWESLVRRGYRPG